MENYQERAKEQLNLLLKVNWHLQDIQDFFGCGKNSASYIRQQACLHHNGIVKFEDKKVSARAVLEFRGLNYENEIKIRKELLWNN